MHVQVQCIQQILVNIFAERFALVLQKKLCAPWSQKWVANQWERWIQLDQQLRPCQSLGWAEQQTGAVRRGVGKSMDSIFSQAGWPRAIVSKKIVENDMFETSKLFMCFKKYH